MSWDNPVPRLTGEFEMNKKTLIEFLEIAYDKMPDEFDAQFGDMGKEDIPDMVDNFLEIHVTEWITRESA